MTQADATLGLGGAIVVVCVLLLIVLHIWWLFDAYQSSSDEPEHRTYWPGPGESREEWADRIGPDLRPRTPKDPYADDPHAEEQCPDRP